MRTHDVIIVGAGPAGSALAYLLSTSGVDVLLLDKASFPRDKTCGDALSPRALHVLRNLGILSPIRASGYEIKRVSFFSPNGNQITISIPPYEKLPDFSLVIPRYIFDDLVRLHAVSGGANFLPQTNVVDVLRDDDQYIGVRALTQNGPCDFGARVTVLATGASISLLERSHLLTSPPNFCRAARTYYEGVSGLTDIIEFHYDSVPLPGYGWIFPISPTAANIGAGYYVPVGVPLLRNSPRQVLDTFITNPRIAHMLANARMTSPVKGFPIRFDFPTVRTAFPGLILVGESCGLVNPLTGEGIDYALESAEVAAEVLTETIRRGKTSYYMMRKYANALRDRFLPTFKSLIRVRDLYIQSWMMNRYVSAAKHNDELALLLVNIGLGNIDPLKAFSPKKLAQILIG